MAKKKEQDKAPIGKGAVLPAGDKLVLDSDSFQVSIAAVHPENGYDLEGKPIQSENFMVTISYPQDNLKNHQVKDACDLMVKITDFLQRRYDVPGGFEFKSVFKELVENQAIEVVVNDG